MSCCPGDYFPLGPSDRADIVDAPKVGRGTRAIVVGGGGLFYFRAELPRLLGSGVPVVGWGIGTNTHGTTAADYAGVDLAKFRALGLRDGGADPWVPCPSCMHRAWDRVGRPTRAAVAYAHADRPGVKALDLPRLANDVATLEAAAQFLGSAEVVVTDTYHGWYWATLLGRRVVLFRPFSSRFHHLPWPPAVAAEPAALHELLADPGRIPAYPGALAAARAANRGFYDRVLEAIDGGGGPA